MIHFTNDDAQMLAHVTDVVGDRMRHEDGYTDQDRATMTKLEALAQAGSAVVVTGADLDREAHVMFRDIVAAELDNWVPNASQRLLYRSGRIVGINQPDPSKGRPDCGPGREQHCLFGDWVAGWFLMRCSSCFRLYEV